MFREEEATFDEEARIRDSRAACASTQGNEGWAGLGNGHVEAERVEVDRALICCPAGFRSALRCLRASFAAFMLRSTASCSRRRWRLSESSIGIINVDHLGLSSSAVEAVSQRDETNFSQRWRQNWPRA